MKCQNCGQEIANDSRFCEFCGAKISKPRRIKILWIVLIVVLGLSALSVGSIYLYDLHRQYIKEVAETKAAQEEAERHAAEALRLAEEAREKARQDSIKAEYAKQTEEKERLEKEKAANMAGYVDLGLPSGTLWKKNDENGYFSNDEAKKQYGKRLPSIDQFAELFKYCNAEWTGNGLRIVGNNGESIFIKAAGHKLFFDEENIEGLGSLISCYTSDPWWIEGSEPSEYLCLFIYYDQWRRYNWQTCSPMEGNTIHLVREK